MILEDNNIFKSLEINSWICTKTHYLNKNFSVSLIYDIKHQKHYFLKGISSNLWDLIVKYKNIAKLCKIVKNSHEENELESLLYELKEKNIINTNKSFLKSNYNYLANSISIESPNFQFFYNKWVEFVCSHGLINMLSLELNYRCNLKCRHCYNHKNIDKYYISYKNAKKVIDEACKLGISIVSITGGECTINPDFLKIAKYVRSKYLELHINTNGQILYDNKKFFNELLKIYPSKIKVSLYSMDKNAHDSITNVNGSWEKTVNIVKELKEKGVDVHIITPVLQYNKDSYKGVKEFANSINVKTNSNCLFIHNPENNNLSAKLNYKDIEQYYIDNFKEVELLKRNKFEKNNKAICEAGFERLCITPRLDVTPCVAVDYNLGNLETMTLTQIYNTTLQDFRKTFIRSNLTECFNEEYCKYCFYCSDTACFNNTFMKKQPILCENAKAYYNAVLYYKNKKE